jgi:hypothetical protein
MSKVVTPIIIIGAPRSGTSVLARILSQHPSLAYANEPRMIWRYGNDHRSDMLNVNHATPDVLEYIQKKFSRLVEEQGRTRLLEKTPSNSLRIEFVDRIFPDAKFVHITRNGYDSTLSIRKFWDSHVSGVGHKKINQPQSILIQRLIEMHPSQWPYYSAELLKRLVPKGLRKRRALWGPRLPGMKQWVDDVELLELCAFQWKTCVERASLQGRKLGERYMECRLEDLNIDSVKGIMEFCELSNDPAVEGYLQSEFEVGKSEKRKLECNPKVLEQIRTYIEPTMSWLGYNV